MRESHSNKVARLRPASLLKKRLCHRCFPVNFAKILRIPFFYRTSLVVASERSIYLCPCDFHFSERMAIFREWKKLISSTLFKFGYVYRIQNSRGRFMLHWSIYFFISTFVIYDFLLDLSMKITPLKQCCQIQLKEITLWKVLSAREIWLYLSNIRNL